MKKLLSLILAVALAAALLACAAAHESQTELRVLMDYQKIDPNADPAGIAVEEVTGVHAVYETLPAEQEVTKLMSILAAREADAYDVIVMSYATFAATVSQGAYLPLNDLLNERGQDLLAATDDALWTNTTVDGQIMGVPYRLSSENYTSGLRVRTDLLESIGVEKLPQTLDELTDMLAAAKAAGLVPFTGNGAIVDEIAGAFGISNTWNVTEDGIHGRPTTPGAREYVEYMRGLYTAGLLDDEWAQNNNAACMEKFLQGKALMCRVFWWNEPSASDTLLENFPEAAYAYLPPLANEAGESGMPVNRGADMVAVIPRVSGKAAEAVEWMNAKVATRDTFRYLCIGEENVHYEVIGEDEYAPIQPAFNDERNNANIFLTGAITADYDVYWSQTRVRKDETMYQEFLKMQENVANATIYYDPVTFMAPNNDFTELAPSVNGYVQDTMLQMIVGARDIGEWDEFVEEYLDMGGAYLEEMLNEWWDANRAEIESYIKR
ncbi:MAG: extracellular solute-binding protein [Clostridia bacterium]|nr:extracellular solute-binding protein [Clostridia bacterium]